MNENATLKDIVTALAILAALLLAALMVVGASGCALTTPDGYSVVIDGKQLDDALTRLESYLAARAAAEERADYQAAERWDAQVAEVLAVIRELQER
jgi:hypothetical protein